MDESLSDFQEKKKCNTGPKKSSKPTKQKVKTIKRIRGQKDIRTAIKPQKNDLVTYANEFDKICKQSGIDVDPEQLQIAIALSKSLQTADNLESQCSESSNSQERTGKIRTTLLEYGFKVPEIKINTTRRKRSKKQNYKLLLTADTEKQQIITDKYAQALLGHLDNSKLVHSHTNDTTAIKLYHIATQESYTVLKSNNLYYIDNLIQHSQNIVGSLLKDWSSIPGRPSSPAIEVPDVNFSDIECSNDELISVLSGPITSAQDIVKNKHMLLDKVVKVRNDKTSPIKLEKNNTTTISKMDSKLESEVVSNPIIIIEETNSSKTQKKNLNDSVEIVLLTQKTLPHTIRSCSPDIFDDEASSICDSSKGNTDFIPSQEVPICKTITNNEVMDLTECVNEFAYKTANKCDITSKQPNSQLSQPSNVTKRKSNDFMEITNCVAGSSQPLIVNHLENIDLTQHLDDKELIIVENDIDREKTVIGNMDLTQSSNTDDELPFVQVSGKKYDSLDETILLNEDAYSCVNLRKSTENPDKEYNQLGSVDFLKANLKNFESTLEIHLVKLSSEENNALLKIGTDTAAIDSDENSNSFHEVLENTLKQSRNTISETSKSKTDSCFEKFEYVHSEDESKDSIEDAQNLDDSEDKDEIYNSEHNYDDTDLTQNSDSIRSTTDETTHKIKSQHGTEVEYNNHDIDLTQSTDSEQTVDDISVTSNKFVKKVQQNHDFDLSQNTDISKNSEEINKTKNPQLSLSSLGKVGNVSIDYDEIFDDVVESYASTSKSLCQSDNSKPAANDESRNVKNYSNSDVVSNCSQHSEIFEIVDEEFDYSLNQSRHNPVDNFDFGGISILDDISKVTGSKSIVNEETITTNHQTAVDRSMSDSLPIVYIKGTNNPKTVSTKSPTKPCIALTPYRNNIKEGIAIETPTNSEYVIKTDQVTPLVDYASMTTPERNKELDKFGLKPFKRKRGVYQDQNYTHRTLLQAKLFSFTTVASPIAVDVVQEA